MSAASPIGANAAEPLRRSTGARAKRCQRSAAEAAWGGAEIATGADPCQGVGFKVLVQGGGNLQSGKRVDGLLFLPDALLSPFQISFRLSCCFQALGEIRSHAFQTSLRESLQL